MKGPQGERLHCGRCETIQRGCNGGFECWIGRIVVERTTVSRVEGSPMLAKKWCVAKWHSRPRPECWLDYTPLPQCNVEDHKNQNDEEADIKRSYYSLRCHGVSRSSRCPLPASSADGGMNLHLGAIGILRFHRISANPPRAHGVNTVGPGTHGGALAHQRSPSSNTAIFGGTLRHRSAAPLHQSFLRTRSPPHHLCPSRNRFVERSRIRCHLVR